MRRPRWKTTVSLPVLAVAAVAVPSLACAADGLFVRFKLTEPKGTTYYVRVAGYIHNSPWYLPRAVVPEGADKDAAKQAVSGACTPWLDLKRHAGERMHGRMARSGGVAEFPNVTADFITAEESDRRTVTVELATAPDEKAVVKRFTESYRGSLTSFLVSPQLRTDAGDLETAAQMTARRLGWARQASGGRAVSPKRLLVQTSFWSPQRDELNLQEAEVLRLLGFNIVGNQVPAVRQKGYFRVPGHTHNVDFSPGVTREDTDRQMARATERMKEKPPAGVPLGFSDEICSRAKVEGEKALEHFHAWLRQKKVRAQDLGASKLSEVVPIHTPEELRERQEQNRAAAISSPPRPRAAATSLTRRCPGWRRSSASSPA